MYLSPARRIKNIGMDNITIVANRAPYTYVEDSGDAVMKKSVSGLVSALEPVIKELGGVWVGWCGRVGENSTTGMPVKIDDNFFIKEIIFNDEDYRHYYHGLSNECLWPMSHCLLEKCRYSGEDWDAYKRVNKIFAGAAAKVSNEKSLVWFHDYHLALAPAYFREMCSVGKLAFFWHIPFPPPEMLHTVPWSKEILQGLLGNDVVAFHLPEYAENFLRSIERVLEVEVDYRRGVVHYQGRQVKAEVLPIGIDYRDFMELAASDEVRDKAAEIRDSVQAEQLVLSVDRLDYTKGILERLQGMERFLELNPKYRDRVTFLQVAVPSRTEIESYAELKRQVEEAVGRINGRFGTNWNPPVRYCFSSLDRAELVAHYQAADVALVTPLRDGLNLVAKEYVASRLNSDGVLVLSPFAGAYSQMQDALPANIYDCDDMAAKIKEAVEMPHRERQKRMRSLQEGVRKQDINWWLQEMITSLARHNMLVQEYKPAKTKFTG